MMVKDTKTRKRAVRIIVVINQKGGVGKTAISFHLAKWAAEAGNRVLAVDADGQGNLSQSLTGDLEIRKREGGAGVLFELGAVPESALTQTQHENIVLLHGHKGLDQFDNDESVEERVYSPDLRLALQNLPYDVIIIDTPPAVGVRHLGPLTWADKAVIPMEPTQNSVDGFMSVLEAIESVQGLNPALQWVGVVNRFNKSSSSHRMLEEFVHTTYGKKMTQTLPTRAAVTDALQENPALPVWRMHSAKREARELWRQFCSKVVG